MSSSTMNLNKYRRALEGVPSFTTRGKVTRMVGLVIEGYVPGTSVGGICRIFPRNGEGSVSAEVVGFRDDMALLMPLGESRGIGSGSLIVPEKEKATVKVGKDLISRVIDGFGEPLDDRGPVKMEMEFPIYREPINPLIRGRIREPLDLGIRAVNGLLTVGCGQRVGIMSGSGVGKSTLMGMIAKNTEADVSVIGLIGERGREVREFIERDLGPRGMEGSVVVVATSDQSPLIRMRGAFVATAVAEFFRSKGKKVLLMIDSITRFAMAQREVGLAAGEPPTTKGYTPSVFSLLPKLLERAGNIEGKGSITGLYAVLVEGDDLSEPVADAVRAILDGHVVLSRSMAMENHYPAIDILESKSRLMKDIVSPQHLGSANRLVRCMAIYKGVEDLINVGAYARGTNPDIDHAIEMREKIRSYLTQEIDEKVPFQESVEALQALFP